MAPPFPDSEDPFLVRTDFSDDAAWAELLAAIKTPSALGFVANLTIIDDRQLEGATAGDLSPAAAKAEHAVLFIADRETMSTPERPVLCLDLEVSDQKFRVVPKELWSVENNLSLANMDPEEFVQAVGVDGVFRGFE